MDSEPIRYDNIDPAVEARAGELLGRMTLAEKIGQLVQLAPWEPAAPQQQPEAGQPVVPQWKPCADVEERIRSGRLGSLLNIAGAQEINRYQRIAVEESRLGIPLLVGADVIHGFRTVFPIPLAESCTWNPPLLEQAARVAAEEASASGIDWIFAPMVDVARDPRWGRVAEGAGEDTFLGMAMARARVRGFQASDLAGGRRVVACPKHYAAYGAAEAGRDYNTVAIGERALREIYLPPFKAAFDAGAGSVMSAFNEIDGVPATASALLMRRILRDEWGWSGVVLSDYEAVRELIPHGVAADLKDAARLSMLAGLDMEMVSEAYSAYLAELVAEGGVAEQLVDDAARRVLRLKLRLGLFERPYTDEALAGQVVLREESRELALEVALQSAVLLQNRDRLLPLPTGGRIAVIGPLADARHDLLGTWSMFGDPDDVESVLDAVRRAAGSEAQLAQVAGCAVQGDETANFSAAVAAAEASDVVVLVLGESADMSGEAHSRAQLGLPGQQQMLVDAIAATGKPMVAVLLCGRPLVIPRLAEQAGAVLVAWHGGIRAGRAVAELLFGARNPSGKLSASWPRSEGQIPVYYAHKNTGRPKDSSGTVQFVEAFKTGFIDQPNEPLFPFGHGLSYTTFEYRALAIENNRLGRGDTLVVSAAVRNAGLRAGAEIVQLYLRDLVAGVTRPIRELRGFERIELEAGEETTVVFRVPVRELGYVGPDMEYVVEPGAFRLWLGPDSTSGLEAEFWLY